MSHYTQWRHPCCGLTEAWTPNAPVQWWGHRAVGDAVFRMRPLIKLAKTLFSPSPSQILWMSVLMQNGSRASPRWVLHIGGVWGEFPPHRCEALWVCRKALYYSSIHPSIFIPLSAEVAVPAGFPKLPFSRPHQLALTGGSRGVPRPVWRYSPSTWSSVYPVASSQLDVPGTPPEGCDQVASLPDARTTSTGSFLRKGAAALLRVPLGWPSFSPYP